MRRDRRRCSLKSLKFSFVLVSVFTISATLATWLLWRSSTSGTRSLRWLPELRLLLSEMDSLVWSAIDDENRTGYGESRDLFDRFDPTVKPSGSSSERNPPGSSDLCPRFPPQLEGGVPVSRRLYLNPWSIRELSQKYQNFTDVTYRPTNCRARHRVAIIIPLRDRDMQLRALLSQRHPIWQRQQIEYTVYTITQAHRALFNRGKLMNIGFSEARKDHDYDCYVFHDVDLLLENDQCLYWCPEVGATGPRHLSSLIDKFGYEVHSYDLGICSHLKDQNIYMEVFGGVSVFTNEQFVAVNGFSNIYWGWGAEDDDLFLRTKKMGYIVDHERSYCSYHMIRHRRDKRNKENPLRFLLLKHSAARQTHDGLNTLK